MNASGAAEGTTLGGRYVLCGAIASGGMATVHLARQLGAAGFSRVVAVKHPHEAYSRHPGFVAMFLDEARLVARIRHPNVVQTLDVVTENGELYIVMEYVHGEALLALTKACTKNGVHVPVGVAAAIVSGALHGLHAAHEATSEAGDALGIVHRDVSPHNVMVGVDGVARVLDFGVAKASERMQETQDGKLKGKFSFMAPEQIRGERIDRRTDVYAAAVMLWETLTGSSLFRRVNEGATLQAVLADPVRPPSLFNRAVTPELDAVVLRGLSRDPAARFQSAHDMALELERVAPPSSATVVAAWVRETCHGPLSERARSIAAIEARSSGDSARAAADSLRDITQSYPRITPPPVRAEIADTQAAVSGPAPTRSRLGVILPLGIAVAGVAVFLGVKARQPKEERVAELPVAATSLAAAVQNVECPAGMVRVDGGRFFMGSDDDLPAEKPAHQVKVSAFCMDKFEVTSAKYKQCSDSGDCKRAPKTNEWAGITDADHKTYDPVCTSEDPARAEHPINCIDWNLADQFCKATGKRLPTEAEWEYAARSSDGRRYPWGDDAPGAAFLNACGPECTAWGKAHDVAMPSMHKSDDHFATTAPVGSFPRGASRWGVEDVVGNVWEWTADTYGAYTTDDQGAPRGPADGKTRVMRGGAWNGAHPDWVRPSFRFHAEPTNRSHGVGFRCAKSA